MSEVKNVQKWFKANIKDATHPYLLDRNQAKIVRDQHQNTLVIARAGSGKTRTIVAKIIYLLVHEKIKPEEIIVFTFNKKACQEINERLTKINYQNTPIFLKPPQIATTFHAFAYQILGGNKALKNRLIIDEESDSEKSQFIARAEQQFFENYQLLFDKINQLKNSQHKNLLLKEFANLKNYHQKLSQENRLNFNQLVANAAKKLASFNATNQNYPYKYIFIDEYQDFSLLFLTITKALRQICKNAHLLAVGDDWQAINRFAGSNVEYFTNFQKYFSEDSIKLRIPTNYRSGKLIVKNANFFMSQALKDFAGCKAKNKQKSQIFYQKCENYYKVVQEIINDNPNKTIKILSRNNNLRFRHLPLEKFVASLKPNKNQITYSTIHRSKGLEADIVILLEIDAEKFPAKDKADGLYAIFGDTENTLFADEARLFYVALTRAKERLYILSKNPTITKDNAEYNFFSYLHPDYLTPLF